MRKCIILFLITGIVWAQTGLDKLVYKDGRELFGEYLSIKKQKIIYFKRQGLFEVQKIHINIIESLKLKDGRIFISDGNLKLTTEEKAIYNKKDRINNFFTILITTSVIVVAGFAIFNPFEGLGQSPGPIFTPPDA